MDVEGVKGWVKQRLSHHLVPKYVFRVATYPKTASGKIQKFVLRGFGAKLVQEGRGKEGKLDREEALP